MVYAIRVRRKVLKGIMEDMRSPRKEGNIDLAPENRNRRVLMGQLPQESVRLKTTAESVSAATMP